MPGRTRKKTVIKPGLFSEIMEKEDRKFGVTDHKGIMGELNRAEDREEYMMIQYSNLCDKIHEMEQDPDIMEHKDSTVEYHLENGPVVMSKLKLYSEMLENKRIMASQIAGVKSKLEK
jgi:hypothetical protein